MSKMRTEMEGHYALQLEASISQLRIECKKMVEEAYTQARETEGGVQLGDPLDPALSLAQTPPAVSAGERVERIT